MNWIRTSNKLPLQGVLVSTKIDDHMGVRNVQSMILHGKLWFTADQAMYVYYTPTHWAEIDPAGADI